MELNEQIKKVCSDIKNTFNPNDIILYNAKRNISGDIIGFKICVIIETDNRLMTERHIYLDIDSDIPFDVLVYTPEEWNELLNEKSSFAFRVIKEGTHIYD